VDREFQALQYALAPFGFEVCDMPAQIASLHAAAAECPVLKPKGVRIVMRALRALVMALMHVLESCCHTGTWWGCRMVPHAVIDETARRWPRWRREGSAR
jgi:hypothetical protein